MKSSLLVPLLRTNQHVGLFTSNNSDGYAFEVKLIFKATVDVDILFFCEKSTQNLSTADWMTAPLALFLTFALENHGCPSGILPKP